MEKEIIVPCLDVIMIASLPRNIQRSSLFARKVGINTERVPPGHPTILLKSNKLNMATVSVKRSIRGWLAWTPTDLPKNQPTLQKCFEIFLRQKTISEKQLISQEFSRQILLEIDWFCTDLMSVCDVFLTEIIVCYFNNKVLKKWANGKAFTS